MMHIDAKYLLLEHFDKRKRTVPNCSRAQGKGLTSDCMHVACRMTHAMDGPVALFNIQHVL